MRIISKISIEECQDLNIHQNMKVVKEEEMSLNMIIKIY